MEAKLRAENPNIFLLVKRNNSSNLVVYEGLKASNGKLDHGSPCEAYWMDIKSGQVKYTRSELSFLERSLAYGFSSTPHPTHSGAFVLKLKALPKRPVVMAMGDNGRVSCWASIGGRKALVQEVYVEIVERLFSLPQVKYMQLTGVDGNGNVVNEKIVP
jgi:hypothetical protein